MKKAIIKSNGKSTTLGSIDLAVRTSETESAAEAFDALREAIHERRKSLLQELATLNAVLGFGDYDTRLASA
jgi:hypothetical protein